MTVRENYRSDKRILKEVIEDIKYDIVHDSVLIDFKIEIYNVAGIPLENDDENGTEKNEKDIESFMEKEKEMEEERDKKKSKSSRGDDEDKDEKDKYEKEDREEREEKEKDEKKKSKIYLKQLKALLTKRPAALGLIFEEIHAEVILDIFY